MQGPARMRTKSQFDTVKQIESNQFSPEQEDKGFRDVSNGAKMQQKYK